MATKRTGISRDLIIHPGETIADLLEEWGMMQSELAVQTGVTAAYVSNVIAGKKDISSGFALALEYALGVPRTFWLTLQANYDAELLTYNEPLTVTAEEREARESLTEVVEYLRQQGRLPGEESVDDSILSLRKFFGFRSIDDLKDTIPTGIFKVAGDGKMDPYVLGAWIRLCRIDEQQHNITGRFDKAQVPSLVEELKKIMYSKQENLESQLATVLAERGIAFSIMKGFKKAPVDGYLLKNKDGVYRMILTDRNLHTDSFWFSLFHELGHVVNGDVVRAGFIDDASDVEKELRADQFARAALGV